MSVATQAAPADSIRAVLDRIFAAPEYDWELRPHPLQFLLDWYRSLLDWLDALATSHPVAYWVVVGLLTGILVVILVHFGYLIVKALRPRAEAADSPEAALGRTRNAAWHLAEATLLGAKGRYAEAVAHRFVALVLQLEANGAVRFHPSKTPAEYLTEARLADEAGDDFRSLVAVLYAYLFGGAPCGEQDVEAFDRRAASIVSGHAPA